MSDRPHPELPPTICCPLCHHLVGPPSGGSPGAPTAGRGHGAPVKAAARPARQAPMWATPMQLAEGQGVDAGACRGIMVPISHLCGAAQRWAKLSICLSVLDTGLVNERGARLCVLCEQTRVISRYFMSDPAALSWQFLSQIGKQIGIIVRNAGTCAATHLAHLYAFETSSYPTLKTDATMPTIRRGKSKVIRHDFRHLENLNRRLLPRQRQRHVTTTSHLR